MKNTIKKVIAGIMSPILLTSCITVLGLPCDTNIKADSQINIASTNEPDADAKISIQPRLKTETVNIGIDETAELQIEGPCVTNIEWSTDDTDYITVSEDGIVTPEEIDWSKVNNGIYCTATATAKVTSYNKEDNSTFTTTLTATINVVRTFMYAALPYADEEDVELQVGETHQLYIAGGSSDTVTWTSDDADIVSVDKEGNLIAKKKGETIIHGHMYCETKQPYVRPSCVNMNFKWRVTVTGEGIYVPTPSAIVSSGTIDTITSGAVVSSMPAVTQTPIIVKTPVVSTMVSVTTELPTKEPVNSETPNDLKISASPEVTHTPTITEIPNNSIIPATPTVTPTNKATITPSILPSTTPVATLVATLAPTQFPDFVEHIDRKPNEKPTAVSLNLAKRLNKTTIRLKWKKLANVKGYQISLSKNRSFTKQHKIKYVEGSKTSCVLKKLHAHQTYYIKLRAYTRSLDGKKLYGKYSRVVKCN